MEHLAGCGDLQTNDRQPRSYFISGRSSIAARGIETPALPICPMRRGTSVA